MLRLLVFLLVLFFAAGCVGPSYYFQSIGGHFDLLNRRKPVLDLLDDEAVVGSLKKQLKKTQELREFAANILLLPTEGTFTQYADLERPFATWVVFATPAYSLQAKTWCFPVTGCLNYLGFFQKAQAEALQNRLEEQGFDVYVGGSAAYSTLGWFDDPLLNTFIHWPQARLAALMFHEMAHQKLYIPGDSTFNESYAEAVSQIGVRLWFEKQGEQRLLQKYDRSQLRMNRFINAVQELRKKLETLYAAPLSETEMARYKRRILTQAASRQDRDSAGGWFAEGLNNAKLSSVNTYRSLVGDFIGIYEQEGKNFEQFHMVIEKIAKQPKAKRMAILKKRHKRAD